MRSGGARLLRREREATSEFREQKKGHDRARRERRRETGEEQKYERERSARRRRESVQFRIDQSIGSSMYQALKSAKNGRSWESLAGYSCTDLVQHLEGQFKAGMSWDNYGKSKGEWSIDHILPRSLFKYDTAESAAFRACWALDNLRPLWAEENSSKGATLELTA